MLDAFGKFEKTSQTKIINKITNQPYRTTMCHLKTAICLTRTLEIQIYGKRPKDF